uniref:Nuclear receptor domain-containing protein n=1 Tax=Ascaris lumbricoides TaxID=6252 RepID=A0A0M3HWE8_ASCLU
MQLNAQSAYERVPLAIYRFMQFAPQAAPKNTDASWLQRTLPQADAKNRPPALELCAAVHFVQSASKASWLDLIVSIKSRKRPLTPNAVKRRKCRREPYCSKCLLTGCTLVDRLTVAADLGMPFTPIYHLEYATGTQAKAGARILRARF